MEISITMSKFSFPKSRMKYQTENAQLFICGDEGNTEKVWIPLKKLSIQESESDDQYNTVVVPKWVYMKSILPLYTQPEEFIVRTEVNPI